MRIREAQGFPDLKAEWNMLLNKNLLGDNVFLTWEWLSTWWKHFGEGRRLMVLLVEEGEEVLGIAPLMLSKYKVPGFGSLKKIEFIGARHSDYHNFILLKKEKDCIGLIMNHLKDNVSDWNWLELKEIPEPARNENSLETLLSDFPSKLRLRKRVCNICPYISLPNSFDLLMKELKKDLRKNMNRYSRKIKKEHHVELRKYDEAGFSVKEAMEVFIRLNEKRWTLKGELGSFKSKEDAFRDFHMDVAECFAQKGWLGLYFLTVDDEPASVQYTFEYKRKMCYYLSGFDPQYSSYSVGNLIIMFLLEKCIEKGFTEYDMLRGGYLYKNSWTGTSRKNFEIRLVRESLLSEFYDWATWNETVNSLTRKLKMSLKRGQI